MKQAMAGIRVLALSSVTLIALAFVVEYIRTHYLASHIHCYTSIKTLSDDAPYANCFTLGRNGEFRTVYTDPSPAPETLIDGYVLPGLWDGHGHVMQYGEMLHSVDLFQAEGLQDVRLRVRAYLEMNAGTGSREDWLRGIGWDQAAFGGVMPTAVDLEADPVLSGKYIMLDRIDVHCIWVSQAVLDLLPKPMPEYVEGGEIVREPGLGVFCDNAMDIVRAMWPKPSGQTKKKWVGSAMRSLNELGIVGVHDAGVMPGQLKMYEELAGGEEWTVRVYAMLECAARNTFCADDARTVKKADGMLVAQSVKLFADGALGSWGSAMIEPYSDKPNTSGSLLVNATTLTSVAKSWALHGFQVNIHAIGDLANRLSINAMTAALFEVCPSESLASCQSKRRFRIEHSQIIHPNDQIRMLDIGIIPSIQPTHATSDMAYAEDRLGPQRTSAEAYRMKSLLKTNPILGSDFPVEPANPFEGIFAAVARRSPRTGLGAGGSNDGWHMSEALTIEDALRGFTLSPARGAFMEGKAGVIQKGSFADWIVLDRSFDGLLVDELRQLKVRETWVRGKKVFSRQNAA
ncbi:amidohydrolase [Pseudovirgaria hyperparasitica]|uniref:Amidohydrolase n=1 Tax=Pseudovirgaria hyperparasitica TaxID=470096 RepID=A0A6A6WA52_9PEZI|nr:amidohydrolase [Pseudovirgaria hyperparasitica]KAF2759553.1 amidohydrolase [Pseudovirgaria hyperparasitica]